MVDQFDMKPASAGDGRERKGDGMPLSAMVGGLLLIAVWMLMPSYALGQKVGTTSMQFLKIMPDARMAAMGGTASLVQPSANAVFVNPAGLASVDDFDVRFSYVDWFVDINVSAASVAYAFDRVGTVALNVTYMGMGEIEETRVDQLGFQGDTYNSGLTGATFSPSSAALGLSYGRFLTSQFSFGVSAKYVREDLGRAAASQVLFDGGLLYRTGYRSVTVSAGVRHFGGDVTFVNEAYPAPQEFYLGISSSVFAPESSLLGDFGGQTLRMAAEITHPRDAGQQYNLGAEYGFRDVFFLRGGYRLRYDTQGLTLGAGIALRGAQLDYAFGSFDEQLQSVHRFTLGVAL